jgi:hypothetical protein
MASWRSLRGRARRGAEAPLYPRNNGNGESNGNGNSKCNSIRKVQRRNTGVSPLQGQKGRLRPRCDVGGGWRRTVRAGRECPP